MAQKALQTVSVLSEEGGIEMGHYGMHMGQQDIDLAQKKLHEVRQQGIQEQAIQQMLRERKQQNISDPVFQRIGIAFRDAYWKLSLPNIFSRFSTRLRHAIFIILRL